MLTLVTAPAAIAVSFEEAVNHLRIDEMEKLVENLIAVATKHLDGRDGWLGRALVTQTWDLTLDAFPDCIRVPLPPLQQVTSITYVDSNGASQTLAAENYTVSPREPALIYPAYGTSWPSTRCQRDAVTVRFTAGYGDAASDVPLPIRHALLLIIGHFYEHREAVMIGAAPMELPLAVDALLYPYRINW